MYLQILQHDLGRFLLAMLGVILFPGCALEDAPHISDAGANIKISEVMEIVYFVPEDTDIIEEMLKPNILTGNLWLTSNKLALLSTSDWEEAYGWINTNQAKAIIIHHSALDKVNQEELQSFFEDRAIPVAGLGIPGLVLAEFLGHPALFTSTWPADAGYTTPYYFYVYSLNLSGSKEEIERLRELGWTPGTQLPTIIEVTDSVGVTFGCSTDSLLADGSLEQMFDLILSHIGSSDPPANLAESAQAEETATKIDRDYLPPAVNEETGEIEYILVPHLIAPEEFYVEQPADAPIAGVPGFPMARLAESQAEDVQRMALFVAENGTFADEETVGFGILSSIRYTFIDGRTLYVSTTHLSPAALEQTLSL